MESAVTFFSTLSPCEYLPDRTWQLRYELVSDLRPAVNAPGLTTIRLADVSPLRHAASSFAPELRRSKPITPAVQRKTIDELDQLSPE